MAACRVGEPLIPCGRSGEGATDSTTILTQRAPFGIDDENHAIMREQNIQPQIM